MGKKIINRYRKANNVKCKSCGSEHEYQKCPAFGQKCRKCHKMNHFAKMCHSEQIRRVLKQRVHTLQQEETDNSENNFFY